MDRTKQVLDAWHVHLEHHHVSDEELQPTLTKKTRRVFVSVPGVTKALIL